MLRFHWRMFLAGGLIGLSLLSGGCIFYTGGGSSWLGNRDIEIKMPDSLPQLKGTAMVVPVPDRPELVTVSLQLAELKDGKEVLLGDHKLVIPYDTDGELQLMDLRHSTYVLTVADGAGRRTETLGPGTFWKVRVSSLGEGRVRISGQLCYWNIWNSLVMIPFSADTGLQTNVVLLESRYQKK